mgnify:CR=1 FL=1
MVFGEEERLLLESLINRQYTDMVGGKGWIISANSMTEQNRCEVSVRFEDGSRLLETRYSAEKWLDMTKPPKVRKLVYKKKV